MSKSKREMEIEQETTLGIAPILPKEKKYGFLDAFLVISGYAIATWCYTQGASVAALLNFKQLIANTFGINLLVLAIVSLPIIFSVRYGIDIWIWLRSIFGIKGCKILTVLAVLANFPWYAVCAGLFSSSMSNLLAMGGIHIPENVQPFLGVGAIIIGTLIAIGGPAVIKWSTRIMVPAMLAVGIIVVIIAMTSVPVEGIMSYQPDLSAYSSGQEAYMRAIELNIAFAFSWTVAMFVFPRMCKKEKSGYWATTMSYGIVAPFFCFAGGVLAIAMFVKFGVMSDDPTYMLASLASPTVALLSLVLVAFANIGTQGIGSYMNAIVLKSSFPNMKYNVFVYLLMIYVVVLTIWDKIVEYFSAFLAVETYLYAPIMALLFVDFFFVKKQKISLKDAFFLNEKSKYTFTNGFNFVGLGCVVLGFVAALCIYNPISGAIYSGIFYYVGASSVSFVVAGAAYLIICKTPFGKKYMGLEEDLSDSNVAAE